MRIGILAHSFSSAFEIYRVVPGHDAFIILSPSPHRSARTGHLANIARFVLATLKGFKPLQLFTTGRLIFLRGPLHDPNSVDTLKKLSLDVGLHKAGVIYRNVTIDAFRLGILNHHIGILPAYRGRSVVEWSILQGDPVGVTVFFIDTGIDTGARILFSEEVDISGCRSVTEAKQYLFSLDKVFFPRALALLTDSDQAFQLNDGSGRRYFVMSKLFTGVVEQLLKQNNDCGSA
ncbi:MAG TPA: formyltransferase family protein [Pyrinomonadaceae bacterium]|nr:formyltransferase family protein [Pyrinomonadaceae bacterium]